VPNPANRRAEANAVLNIGGYIPAGLLPVATGYLFDLTGLDAGATTFASILAKAACLAANTLAMRLRKD